MPTTKRKKLGRAALLEEMVLQLQIGNTAVKKAQDKNRRLGIPNVYSIGGKIVRVTADNKATILA
ncbi:MAG TPA: hypothetical protein PLU46_03775 [Thiotrichales bacterium]|jgi:hypothetical protein|nr:MAG: hypothetical protein B7X85_00065 [Thiotrichales bacterium 17-46-47]HQT01971.1 hypothetical protein [Thiotrichales bacterium]HQT04087.1 hypothetical protein [Thiotrichales bacterium]